MGKFNVAKLMICKWKTEIKKTSIMQHKETKWKGTAKERVRGTWSITEKFILQRAERGNGTEVEFEEILALNFSKAIKTSKHNFKNLTEP